MEVDDKGFLLRPGVNRREFVGATAAVGLVSALPETLQGRQADKPVDTLACSLMINKEKHELQVDPRTTLLDLLRETVQLTGTKKGCDHGQCGACTVLVNGQRINSCMTLAIMQNGREVTTIEGLAQGNELHPMQAAFIEYDGFQCGYCTPGQICSAVAMLEEAKNGAPSVVTKNLAAGSIELTAEEIRERMSGNICRCGAYAGIVAAIQQVHQGSKA